MTFDRLGKVTVWDTDAEKVAADFPGIPPLALTSDGTALAYDDTDSPASFPTIRVLNLKRSPPRPRVRVFRRFHWPGCAAGPIAFSPDGKLLAAKVVDLSQTARLSVQSEAVELRDVSSGQVRAVLNPNVDRHNGWFFPKNAWFSPDGRTLFLEDLGGYGNRSERIEVWDLSGASPRLGLRGPSESFTPDGSRGAIAQWDVASRWNPVSRNDSVVEVFDLHAPKARIRLVEPGIVDKATISPSGRIMALPSHRAGSGMNRTGTDRSCVSSAVSSAAIRSAFGDPHTPRSTSTRSGFATPRPDD